MGSEQVKYRSRHVKSRKVQVSIRVSASACLGEEEPESQGEVQVCLQVRVKGQGQQDSPAKLTKGEVKISRKKIRKREI